MLDTHAARGDIPPREVDVARQRKGKRTARAKEAAPAGEVKICTECKRDPREFPQAKVVAKGLCNKDYAAFKRREARVEAGLPAEPEPKRSGAGAGITVHMPDLLKRRVLRVADLCKQSVSLFSSEVLEKAVSRVERDLGLQPLT
jgi:hypothetical protein